MSQEWIDTSYVIIGLLTLIVGGLEAAFEKEEKKALAQRLNARILRTRDDEPSTPVFIEIQQSWFTQEPSNSGI